MSNLGVCGDAEAEQFELGLITHVLAENLVCDDAMINSFEAKDFCTTEAIVSFEGNFTAGEPSGLSQSTNSTSRNPLLSASNFLR